MPHHTSDQPSAAPALAGPRPFLPAIPLLPPRPPLPPAPQAFYLHNHSATDLHAADLARLPALSQRPVFASKDEFTRWSHDGRTRHVYYTLAEPEAPTLRSSGQNRVRRLHGVVADYDGDAALVQRALAGLRFPRGAAPTWVTTTFSGKARLIWVFARPVPVYPEATKQFLALLARSLGLKKLLPGLDGNAWGNLHQVYELGTDWRQPWGDTRLPDTLVLHALHEASAQAKWLGAGPEIPLEAVEAEVERRWPGRWAGPLEEGARGVRFWDPAADNPSGCTIRRKGVQAWSGEGRFIPWAELLGRDFVRSYQEARFGGAIEGTWFDGRCYWQHDEQGILRDLTLEAIKRHLGARFGLSARGERGQQSEIAQAVTTIDRLRRVDGAYPCLFVREPVVTECGGTYLNISRVAPVAPRAGGPVAWGEGFPWLAEYLTQLLGEPQLAVFLAWLGRFYRGARAGRPVRGQALLIAGPASAGKSFLSRAVVGPLMGGFAEASNYLMGRSNFNESLFFAPVWAIDDGVPAARPGWHGEYSGMIKKFVANPDQVFNPKFKKEVLLPYHGRLMATCNDTPRALAAVPDLDTPIRDKLILLHSRATTIDFRVAPSVLAGELPALAAHLEHLAIPDWLLTRPAEVMRFGHDAWQNPELAARAQEATGDFSGEEYLGLWREHYFLGMPGAPVWTGTVTALQIELLRNEVLAPVIRRMTRHSVARDLQHLIRQGCPWLSYQHTNTARLYTIQRPTPEEEEQARAKARQVKREGMG